MHIHTTPKNHKGKHTVKYYAVDAKDGVAQALALDGRLSTTPYTEHGRFQIVAAPSGTAAIAIAQSRYHTHKGDPEPCSALPKI